MILMIGARLYPRRIHIGLVSTLETAHLQSETSTMIGYADIYFNENFIVGEAMPLHFSTLFS